MILKGVDETGHHLETPTQLWLRTWETRSEHFAYEYFDQRHMRMHRGADGIGDHVREHSVAVAGKYSHDTLWVGARARERVGPSDGETRGGNHTSRQQ